MTWILALLGPAVCRLLSYISFSQSQTLAPKTETWLLTPLNHANRFAPTELLVSEHTKMVRNALGQTGFNH